MKKEIKAFDDLGIDYVFGGGFDATSFVTNFCDVYESDSVPNQLCDAA